MKIEQLEELKKEVEASVKNLLGDKLKKIILYGSYARGDYNEESDVDFVAIAEVALEEINKYDDEITDFTFKFSLKYQICVSVMILSNENFYGFREILPFYSNIIREGISVYGVQ
jgi:uncharacterized protein